MNRKQIILLMVVATLFFSGVPESMARPNLLQDFKNNYPGIAGTRIDSCLICHLIKSNAQSMNPYGATYLKSGNLPYIESNDSVYQKSLNFTLIESNDSDNDGYTNIQEIRNLTFPGDANDKPGSLNPNITVTIASEVLTTAVVTPTPAFTTVAKTPGFEMVLTVIALLAIFMGFKRRFV